VGSWDAMLRERSRAVAVRRGVWDDRDMGESTFAELKVLVAEDHDDLRELFRFWLERTGATVTEASNGVEALERVQTMPPPDVILCDLHMPGMDGCAFLSLLKERAGLEHIPVIAVTGSESDRALMRTLEAGFTAHLVKPVTSPALIAQIKRVMGR
jgi:CheY-like chemotaxis protein